MVRSEPDRAVQEQVAQAAGQVFVAAARDCEQLLGEERVALAAGHDRLRHRGREWLGRGRVEQGHDVAGVERSQVQHRTDAGASDAVGEGVHASA